MAKELAKICSAKAKAESAAIMDLVCQVDSLTTLRSVVDNGANWVHLNVDVHANGLNRCSLIKAIRYAHGMRCKVLLALDGRSQPHSWELGRNIIHHATQFGVDALISSDPAMLLYATVHYPDLRLHMCMPESAAGVDCVDLFRRQLGIKRIVMPRVSSLCQIEEMIKSTAVELEILGFGKLCAIVQGRRTVSVDTSHESSDERISRLASSLPGSGEDTQAAYIDRCATAQNAANESCYAIQDTPDINTLKLLPLLMKMGVRAVKVEAQGYNPSYGARVTRVWREAIDNCLDNLQRYSVKPSWIAALTKPAGKFNSC